MSPVAREARMRVAVDEARERAEPAPVELLDVAVQGAELAHPPHLGDAAVLAQDVAALDDVDAAEIDSPQRRARARRGHDLLEVADEQPPRGRRLGAHSAAGGIGGSSPPSAAASIASE